MGDWLDPQAPPGEPFKAKADSHVVATACCYRTACTVADTAELLGRAFTGTPYLTDALTQTGHLDDAYRLLLERGCPSWLYPVTMGVVRLPGQPDREIANGRHTITIPGIAAGKKGNKEHGHD